jgi:hypothetical protein
MSNLSKSHQHPLPACTQPTHVVLPVPGVQTEQHLRNLVAYLMNKNKELGTQLGVCVHQLQISIRQQQMLERANHELSGQLMASRAKLQQEEIARDIWTPMPAGIKRGCPDPMLIPVDAGEDHLYLGEDDPMDRPLTVKRVAEENGFKCSKKDLYQLSGHIYAGFLNTRGKPPTIRVVHDKDGMPSSLGCFVERDRGLILAVLDKFGEREGPAGLATTSSLL